eukprot:g2121.t1
MPKKERKADKKGKNERRSWENIKRKDKNAEKQAERTIYIALAVIVLFIAAAPPSPPRGAAEDALVSLLVASVVAGALLLVWRLRGARSEHKRKLESGAARRLGRLQKAKSWAGAKQKQVEAAAERKAHEDHAALVAAAEQRLAQAAAAQRGAAVSEAARAAYRERKAAAYARRRELRARGLLPSVEETAAAAQRAREERAGVYVPSLRRAAGDTGGAPGAGGAGAGPGTASRARTWTAAEDAALEHALAVYPPSYTHSSRERWKAVADAVNADLAGGAGVGHVAPRECEARYRAVRREIEAGRRARKAVEAAARQREQEAARRRREGGGGGGGGGDAFGFDDVDEFETPGRGVDSDGSEDDASAGAAAAAEAAVTEELWGAAGAQAAAAERMQAELDPARTGTRVGLVTAEQAGIGTMTPERLHLQLACARCGSDWTPMLSGADAAAATASAWCPRCSALLRASLRPCLRHDTSDTLAYIDFECCELLDVLPSAVHATCLACSHGNIFGPPRLGLQRGNYIEANCMECHSKMKCRVVDIAIEMVTPCKGRGNGGGGGGRGGAGGKGGGGGGGRSGGADADELEAELKQWRRKSKGDRTQAAIKLGTPLPLKGACVHFKKSFRWLRFPCCGRAHPCPLCHEASGCPLVRDAARDEEALQRFAARRMLCGQCSFEQPISDKPCLKCGFKCTPKGTAHWEGGAGSRNVGALSNKESKKFKGGQKGDTAKHKTASKKSSRVGAAAKQARAAKQSAKQG